MRCLKQPMHSWGLVKDILKSVTHGMIESTPSIAPIVVDST